MLFSTHAASTAVGLMGRDCVRIAIVEDNEREQKRIASFIKQYFDEQGKTCQISLFSDGDEIVEHYTAQWDLIFLDIQMERLDGMATAEKIRKLDQDVFLVFITNIAHYAIKGYAVHALDFLIKPVHYRILQQLLSQVERLLKQRKKKFITLPTENGLMRISVSEIYYVEVKNHVLFVVTMQGVFRMRGTITGMEEILKDYNFFRCKNCYLINLSQVSRVEKGLVVVGGHELAVARPKQKELMTALTQYIGEAESHE